MCVLPKVYLTSPIHPEAQALLAQHTILTVGHDNITRDEFLFHARQADIVLNKLDPIKMDAEFLDTAPNLRLIARHGSGYSNIDIEHATRKNIIVTTTPGANVVSIAEYTIGLMFASVRNLVSAANASHEGNPERLQFMGMEVFGKTFGIIGVGHIGKEVVRRAAALGMNVLAYHPRPSASGLADLPLELVDLERLMRDSDVISIHCPLTEQTRNLISERELALVRPSAHILNLSRGGIVVESAVCRALQEGRLAGYATDVLAHEPVRADDPLLSAPRALVLPHIAAVTTTAQRNVAMLAAAEIIRFINGERPHHIVNPAAWIGPWTGNLR